MSTSVTLLLPQASLGFQASAEPWEWHPGTPSTGNLGGTYSSLDQIGSEAKSPLDLVGLDCAAIEDVRVTNESLHCAPGELNDVNQPEPNFHASTVEAVLVYSSGYI
jgi:hypothetical protein